MKKPNKIQCSGTKIRSHSFFSKYYDDNGVIKKERLNTHSSILFLILNLIVIFGIYSYYFYNETLSKTFNEFISNTIDTLKEFFINSTPLPTVFIDAVLIGLCASLPIFIYYRYKVRKAAKFQSILSSAGLQQYRLVKKKDKKYYLVFNDGTKNAFDTFLLQKDNLAQMLGFTNLKFKRWKQNGVIIQASESFPTIEDLLKLKIKNFLKEEYIFMGIGLPNIDEQYKKGELLSKKFLPRYIKFNDIPVGTANLGSAGGGKSNSMNMYLYSIFYNFEKISQFIFVDFKGGLEAAPFLELENKYRTNKIKIFDDNRIELYKTLKLLHFKNKARMKYLKSNKLKKLTSDYIVLLFDELAEILDFTPTSKEDRFIQEKISFYLDSLLRTGRSQGFKIIYSTQSYLSNSSGLTSSMKNNTKLKIAHQLGSPIQVSSIKPIEELEQLSINPTKFDVGRNVVINESNNEIFETRSILVEDNFIEEIEIKTSSSNFEEKMKPFYEQTLKDMEKELNISGTLDDEIFGLNDIAEKLGLDFKSKAVVKENNIKSSDIPKKVSPTKPKNDIAKTINKRRPTQKTQSNSKEIQDFLHNLKQGYNDD